MTRTPPAVGSRPDREGMLIQVSASNRPISAIDKQRAHDGDGLLHRAFSVFVVDADGHVLLQRRSTFKRLWPGFWSNSFCSHPHWGESARRAALRRAPEELGFSLTRVRLLYRFTYFARYLDVGSERELCSVYLARVQMRPAVAAAPCEVTDWRWWPVEEIDRKVALDPHEFTPWFQLEWPVVRCAVLAGRITAA